MQGSPGISKWMFLTGKLTVTSSLHFPLPVREMEEMVVSLVHNVVDSVYFPFQSQFVEVVASHPTSSEQSPWFLTI